MIYFVLALSAANLALLVFLYPKVRRIDVNTWVFPKILQRQALAEFRQIEALLALYTDLKLEHSLPQTRRWVGSPDFLAYIAKAILRQKPSTIVECSSGVSTLVAARACQLNGIGHVFSLEHDAVFANRTREMLHSHGVADWATVLHAPLRATPTPHGKHLWYTTTGLPELGIELLVIDGPPRAMTSMARYPAGPQLLPRMAEKGLVILDDANRPEERRAVELWLQEFPLFSVEHPAAEKGLAVLVRQDPAGSPQVASTNPVESRSSTPSQ